MVEFIRNAWFDSDFKYHVEIFVKYKDRDGNVVKDKLSDEFTDLLDNYYLSK